MDTRAEYTCTRVPGCLRMNTNVVFVTRLPKPMPRCRNSVGIPSPHLGIPTPAGARNWAFPLPRPELKLDLCKGTSSSSSSSTGKSC
eukprot:2662664-Rhodomonas_salina.3